MSVSIRSLASTRSPSSPAISTLKVSGTRSQVLPVAMPTATSVEPMPVAKAPSAPAVQVCESAPMTRSPGFAYDSATRWWLTPSSTSESVAPARAQNSRIVRCALASSLRGAGAAWSMKNTQVGACTHRGAELVDLLDRQRPGAVLGDRHVDVADHDLAGLHLVEPGVRGEQPLGQGERPHPAPPAAGSGAPPLPIGTASPSRVM